MTTPRVKVQCAYCKIQDVDSSEWIDAENVTSIEIADLHVHKPRHLTDVCDDFIVIDQKGMFDEVVNMSLEEIEKWAKAIQTVALKAPFGVDVYLKLCRDMQRSNPIDYDELMEAYEGKFENFADFAKAHYDYMREDIPSFFYDYIDWEGISRKLERRGYFYYADFGHPREVHVFNSGLLKGNIK